MRNLQRSNRVAGLASIKCKFKNPRAVRDGGELRRRYRNAARLRKRHDRSNERYAVEGRGNLRTAKWRARPWPHINRVALPCYHAIAGSTYGVSGTTRRRHGNIGSNGIAAGRRSGAPLPIGIGDSRYCRRRYTFHHHRDCCAADSKARGPIHNVPFNIHAARRATRGNAAAGIARRKTGNNQQYCGQCAGSRNAPPQEAVPRCNRYFTGNNHRRAPPNPKQLHDEW